MTRPANRAFRARVQRVERMTPNFSRVTFTGDDLEHFGWGGLDQRTKLLFPHADGTWAEFGLFDPSDAAGWYQRWRGLPDEQRNTMRTYTIRAARPQSAELDIDFVLHGTAGPASAWATSATAGDEVAILGPDLRAGAPSGGGIEWRPGTARRVLLAGDETAVPAICTIIESLGPEITGLALLEVPTSADVLPVANNSGVEVRWLGRDGAPHGQLLDAAVREWGAGIENRAAADVELQDPEPDGILWDSPADLERREYAWLAGESGVITGLRRHLVWDLGLDRASVAFMGYWKQGRAEN